MLPTNPDPGAGGLHQSAEGVKPLQFSPRIPSLDALRGIAVLGALFVSIWIFGGFSQNQQNGLLLQSKGFDYRLWGTVELLLDGKIRALIAMVFGAGMLLFLSKDHQKGNVGPADFFMRRQMWLIAFGIINGILLLWTNDVLFHLGVMGILLFPFTRLPIRGLFLAAVLTTLIYSAKNYWNYADQRTAYHKYQVVAALEKKLAKDSAAGAQSSPAKAQKKDTLTREQKDDKANWEGIAGGMKYDPKKDDGENKVMRNSSYGNVYNHLLSRTQVREARWTYTRGVWDFSGMIFLGMALFGMGFFNGRFSGKKYILLALSGLAAGLLLGWYRLHYNQVALQDFARYVEHHFLPYDLFFPFERAFMALGYASLVLFCINAGFLQVVWKAFGKVGQLALTSYLAQSLICSLFFTGVSMGYFGRLHQNQLYFMAAEICLVQTVFSVIWLRYYQYGPFEWLWRCLIYKKKLPNRIIKPETEEPAIPALS